MLVKFSSRKDVLFSSIIIGLSTMLLGFMVYELITNGFTNSNSWVLLLIIICVGFLYWIYFGTKYELSSKEGFVYKSGPVKGKISIDRFSEIIKGKTMWGGLKPATAKKWLNIKYNKFDEIYISPNTNESFIEHICKMNDKIKVTE